MKKSEGKGSEVKKKAKVKYRKPFITESFIYPLEQVEYIKNLGGEKEKK